MNALRRTFCSVSALLGKELHQNDSVIRVILKDVKRRNALSLAMIEELIKETGILSWSRPARVEFFLKAEAGENLHQKVFDRCSSLMMLIRRMQVPVIAEVGQMKWPIANTFFSACFKHVNGIAAAAGCQLVTSCDIVVAADTSKFLVPGQKVGLFCSTPGIPLARTVPHKIALDMLLTGEPIDAQSALRYGLVSRVVPESEVTIEALKVAQQIGRHSRSVTALGKAFFYSQTGLGLSDAYRSFNDSFLKNSFICRFGGKIMTENLKMEDAQEGINAFMEKRKPVFTHTDKKVV
ncbi:enoyl-CoA hydratase/isomerase family protein [Dictyocaulus viviparus]|uniref:Enoyl-CoA hydratase domain-containing protein 3, mitochondrial n=1 Tax=Dictyocaulus viviparus TaxID=29172 RepID=A0A0D8Y687_DICVI|nr:enoyl-CoA hydratase/isomerase family protein [Dictyocaulus viviparus]